MSLVEFVGVTGVVAQPSPGADDGITGASEIVAVRVPTEHAATVRAVLAALSDGLAERAAVDALVEQLTTRQVGHGSVPQARRNAVARDALAAEFGLFTSGEVAELAGSQEQNAAQWRGAGRIFAVTVSGVRLFPGFQVVDGQPLPAAARVLDVVGGRLSSWSLTLCFTGPNSWPGGVRPVDVLTTDPDEVVMAAGKLADQLS